LSRTAGRTAPSESSEKAPGDADSSYDYTWVTPEESLAPGTRVSFRGSTYVDGVLLPQGEPLQGLCSMLGFEYKQAVTKTRCDVLVTDAPQAIDGKMKMARMHNKPLIHQEDFDAWAKQKLAELDYDDANDALSEDHDDELTVTHVEPTSPPMTTPVDNAIPGPAPEQPVSEDWVSYEEYLAAPVPAPATASAASTLPAAPMS